MPAAVAGAAVPTAPSCHSSSPRRFSATTLAGEAVPVGEALAKRGARRSERQSAAEAAAEAATRSVAAGAAEAGGSAGRGRRPERRRTGSPTPRCVAGAAGAASHLPRCLGCCCCCCPAGPLTLCLVVAAGGVRTSCQEGPSGGRALRPGRHHASAQEAAHHQVPRAAEANRPGARRAPPLLFHQTSAAGCFGGRLFLVACL